MKNWQKYKINPGLKIIQEKRAEIKDLIREFFKKEGFLEVETPILVRYADLDPYISPIKVSFRDEKNNLYQGYLITSPEFSLKKMLAAGFEKIFQMTKVFRQEESFGPWHNPEFTILEWYRQNGDYRDIMKDTENLIYFLVKKLFKRDYFIYQGNKINVSLPWQKMTLKEAFKIYANIDLDKTKNISYFKNIILKKGYQLSGDENQNDLFSLIFLNEIEPKLEKNKPIILYDYPIYQKSLAKRKSKNSFYVERFEVFIGGLEIANSFSELLDWQEQLKRFKENQRIRRKLKKENIPIDNELIDALKCKIKKTGGIALGVDRLEMLLLNIGDINNLLMFPAKDLFN
jgi:lysyl-tRNA synthetase class 2